MTVNISENCVTTNMSADPKSVYDWVSERVRYPRTAKGKSSDFVFFPKITNKKKGKVKKKKEKRCH